MVICYSNLNGKNDTCSTTNNCIAHLHHENEKNLYSCNFGYYKKTLCNHWSNSRDGFFYILCCEQEICNNVTLHSLIQNISNVDINTHAQPRNNDNLNINILFATAILLFLIFALSLVFIKNKKYRIQIKYIFRNVRFPSELQNLLKHDQRKPIAMDSSCYIDRSSRIDSRHANAINTKSFKDYVELLTIIGRGRYGKVYLALFNGENIAIKIIDNNFEIQNELEYLSSFCLCHRNIVKYLTHDTIFDESIVHWLAMPYFENGNLYSYLGDHVLSVRQSVSMINNIASGLHYLHCIFDPRIKPRIAHRDLKSSNILIDADLQCCIGDLGLAICDIGWSNASLTSYLSRKSSIQVGTKRYMAPELLSLTFNEKSLSSYLKMDIYSLSLVIWEIFNRVEISGIVVDSSLPYDTCTGSDPTIDNMNYIVNDMNHRPTLRSSTPSNDHLFSDFNRIIRKCWKKIPLQRPDMKAIVQYSEFLNQKYSQKK